MAERGARTLKTLDAPNRIYWAGVWFAFGLGIVVGGAMTRAASWAQVGVVLLAMLAAFGSWYTAGAIVGIMLVMIAEAVGVIG